MHLIGHMLIAAAAALVAYVLALHSGTKERNRLREQVAYWIARAADARLDHNWLVNDYVEMEVRATKAENERDFLKERLREERPDQYEKLYPIIVPRLTADTTPSTH